MSNYAVITRERMTSEFDGTKRISVKIGTSDLQNGSVLVVGDLIPGEREIYSTSTPAANTELKKIVILTTPEVEDDERKKNLSDFVNKAGSTQCTADYLCPNDIFSLTAEGFDGTPAKDMIVELQAGTKLKVVSNLTSSSTKVGKIIDVKNGKYAVKVTD